MYLLGSYSCETLELNFSSLSLVIFKQQKNQQNVESIIY